MHLKRHPLFCLVLLASLFLTTACHRDIPVTDIFVDPAAKTLFIGESFDLQVQYLPEDATNADEIQVYSTNESIVSYANGKVTAKDGGSAAITASCGNLVSQCRVKVYKYAHFKDNQSYGIDYGTGYLLMMGEESVQALQVTFVHLAADGSTQNFEFYIKAAQLGTDIDFTKNAGEAMVSTYANNNEDGYTIYINDEGRPVIVTADWSHTDLTLTSGILHVDHISSNRYIVRADFELSSGYRFGMEWDGPVNLTTE